MNRPLWTLSVLLAVCALVSTACTESVEEMPSTTGATRAATSTLAEAVDDSEEAPESQTFRIGLISPITTDNWWKAMGESGSSADHAYLGYGKVSLFTLTEPGFVYVPGIAATSEPVAAVQDNGVWTVDQPIQDDWTWSDGTTVTAHDLVFYFNTVREFDLDGMHPSFVSPSVTSLSAVDDYTVHVEFSHEPGLAEWQHGVGMAPFVPRHFWEVPVDDVRATAAEYGSTITDDDAIEAIIRASLDDDDPLNDLTTEELTPEDVEHWKREAVAGEGRRALYAIESPMEPSAGSQIFSLWRRGEFARTVSNPDYSRKGTKKTIYANGSVRISNDDRREHAVYGGDASGEIIAEYVEGPFVEEILWIETRSRKTAYEMLAAKEIDFVLDETGITAGIREQLASVPGLSFSVSQRDGFRYAAFNLRKPPMSDPAFRQAVANVVDKEFIANTVLEGAVFPAYTIVHPGLIPFYNDDVKRPGWADGAPLGEGERFEMAVEILRNAGYSWQVEPEIDPLSATPVIVPGEGLTMPNGERVPGLKILSPRMGDDRFRATFAIHMEEGMRKLGIPVEVAASSFDSIIEAVFRPQTAEAALEWDLYILGWGRMDVASPGASQVIWFHSSEDTVRTGGFNTTGYRSEEFDAVADAFSSATDLATAAELTMRMEAIIARDLPYLVLFRTPVIEAIRSNVVFPVETIMGGHAGFARAWPNAVQLVD